MRLFDIIKNQKEKVGLKKRNRYIIAFILSFGLTFAFLQILFNLFPFCGFKVIISFLIHFILATVTGILLANVIWLENKSKLSKGLYIGGIVIMLFMIQSLTYTQDSGESTTKKIVNSIRATINYSNLNEKEYLNYNDEEKIVFNAKFNKERNKAYYAIQNTNTGKNYFITREGNKLSYDESKLKLDIESTTHRIIEIDFDGKKIVSEIGNIENLLNIKSGGYKNWIIEKFNTELVGYEILLDKMNRK